MTEKPNQITCPYCDSNKVKPAKGSILNTFPPKYAYICTACEKRFMHSPFEKGKKE